MVKITKNFKRLQAIAITALITSLLAFSYQASLAKCLPANSMWIEPSTITLTDTTSIGYRFNVTIYANISIPSYAWQFYLTYNKNHLNATGCWYSAGAKSQWAGPRPTSPQTPSYGSHNTTHNYVLFAESLQGIVETPPGSYSLAIVEFEVVAAPPQGQVYRSELRLDISGAFSSTVLDVDLNDIQLNFAGTTYIIDEFSAIMFLMALMLATACAVLLRRSKNHTAYPLNLKT